VWDVTLTRIDHVPYVEVREKAGREAGPTLGIIDIQSAKGALRLNPQAVTRARRRSGESAAF
jgi:hypothetical protein